MSEDKKSIFYFSPQERIDLLISWVTLSIAFALMIFPMINPDSQLDPIMSIPISFLAVGTGFVFHELAHREAAKHFGFHSEFRAWYPGLALAVFLVVISGGRFIFAAPGATYFFGVNVSRKQNGIISIAGPLTNLIIGTIFFILLLFTKDIFLGTIFWFTARTNFWFALFNLIPFGPLDGSKVIAWRGDYWLILTAISAIMVFLIL